LIVSTCATRLRHGKGEIAQLGEGGGEAERFAGARKTASQSAIGGKGGRQFIIQERGDLLP
jgi:hypothetical protein